MKPTTAATAFVLVLMAMLFAAGATAADKQKQAGPETSPARIDPAQVAELIRQLGSDDFSTRDRASRELAKLDQVPDALRTAIGSADPEVARRAEAAVSLITARNEERDLQAMVRNLDKVELDRFVRRMVSDERFAGDKQWDIVQMLARRAAARADELGGRKYGGPVFEARTLPFADLAVERVFRGKRVLVKDPSIPMATVQNCFVLAIGETPRINGLTNSIVIVDGDFSGSSIISNSLLIVRGNVGLCNTIRNSIILATGNFDGATACDDSFVQVDNHQIRFARANGSVLVDTQLMTTAAANSRVIKVDKGPLQSLKFSARKTDAQLSWGKEVNGLAAAITPTERKNQFLIRWKNTGKDTVQVPWVRLKSDRFANRDDLLEHVFLKGADGKRVPGRKMPVGGAALIDRTVVLGPGRTHEEIIDLWDYVDRPPAAARFQLWIELDIPQGRRGRELDVKMWSGKIQSNVLDVTFGK